VQQLQEASRRASEAQRALERERVMHEQTLSEVAAEHARYGRIATLKHLTVVREN